MRSLRDINEETEETYLLCLYVDHKPLTFQEVVNGDCRRRAIEEEIHPIEKNNTWELNTLPPGQKAIGIKWLFKIKRAVDGEINRYKARLVAKCYKQQYGLDYQEVSAPVTRLDTVRMLIFLAAHHSWRIYKLDVNSAFLIGILDEKVYVEQLEGFIVEDIPIKESFIWAKAGSTSMDCSYRHLSTGKWLLEMPI